MDERASFRRRLRLSVALLLTIGVGGTLGYHFIEGWSLLESFYMVVITVTTVGFGLVDEVGTPGLILTLVILIFGVGSGLYGLATIAEYVVEGHLAGSIQKRRRERMLERVRNHYIVCGYGRVGQGVASELLKQGEAVCVVDADPQLTAFAESVGLPTVLGDATEERTLIAAGISRCKGLVAALGSDERNAFTTLSARVLAPNVKIVARAENDSSVAKLRLVGANYAITPYDAGALQMTFLLTRPLLAEALTMLTDESVGEMVLRQIEIAPGSSFSGRPIRELEDLGMRVSVLALKRGEEDLRTMPGTDSLLQEGDQVVAVGTPEDLARLAGQDAGQ